MKKKILNFHNIIRYHDDSIKLVLYIQCFYIYTYMYTYYSFIENEEIK